MVVYPEGVMYYHVQPDDVAEIVTEHLLKGRFVKRLMTIQTSATGGKNYSAESSKFFAKQLRIALRNCGNINPESIDEYIGNDGYFGLAKIFREKMKPEDVIEEIKMSGLRGRGGVVSNRSEMGIAAVSKVNRNMFAVMLTKATPAHLWTAQCLKVIRTA